MKKGFVNLYCNFRKGIDKESRKTSYLVITKIPRNEKDRTLIMDQVFTLYSSIRNISPRCGNFEAHYMESGNKRREEWESMTRVLTM